MEADIKLASTGTGKLFQERYKKNRL